MLSNDNFPKTAVHGARVIISVGKHLNCKLPDNLVLVPHESLHPALNKVHLQPMTSIPLRVETHKLHPEHFPATAPLPKTSYTSHRSTPVQIHDKMDKLKSMFHKGDKTESSSAPSQATTSSTTGGQATTSHAASGGNADNAEGVILHT